MEFKGNPDYAYAVGVIRVKEKELLNRERFSRLVEAKDVYDLLRLLSDTPYGEISHEDSHPESALQDGLKRELLKSLSLFSDLCSDETVRETVFLRYDFHNLKVIFKEKVSEGKYEAARFPDGIYPFDTLKSAIEENAWWDIRPDLREVFRECRKRIEKNPRPHDIDNVLDRAMYKTILTKLDDAIPFIREWIVSEIDLTNIGAFFRCRYAGRPRAYLLEALINGGYLDISFFQKVWDEPFETLPAKFQHTSYRRVVEKGVEVFQKDSFAPLDRAMMEHRLVFHHETRSVAMGIEPLISYLFFKEAETKVLRMILVGKMNRIDAEILREFIPNALG